MLLRWTIVNKITVSLVIDLLPILTTRIPTGFCTFGTNSIPLYIEESMTGLGVHCKARLDMKMPDNCNIYCKISPGSACIASSTFLMNNMHSSLVLYEFDSNQNSS